MVCLPDGPRLARRHRMATAPATRIRPALSTTATSTVRSRITSGMTPPARRTPGGVERRTEKRIGMTRTPCGSTGRTAVRSRSPDESGMKNASGSAPGAGRAMGDLRAERRIELPVGTRPDLSPARRSPAVPTVTPDDDHGWPALTSYSARAPAVPGLVLRHLPLLGHRGRGLQTSRPRRAACVRMGSTAGRGSTVGLATLRRDARR